MAETLISDHHCALMEQYNGEEMIETLSRPTPNGIRTFEREDGATVECHVKKGFLALVVVKFSDGNIIEIDPNFVDHQMIEDGLGHDCPKIN